MGFSFITIGERLQIPRINNYAVSYPDMEAIPLSVSFYLIILEDVTTVLSQIQKNKNAPFARHLLHHLQMCGRCIATDTDLTGTVVKILGRLGLEVTYRDCTRHGSSGFTPITIVLGANAVPSRPPPTLNIVG